MLRLIIVTVCVRHRIIKVYFTLLYVSPGTDKAGKPTFRGLCHRTPTRMINRYFSSDKSRRHVSIVVTSPMVYFISGVFQKRCGWHHWHSFMRLMLKYKTGFGNQIKSVQCDLHIGVSAGHGWNKMGERFWSQRWLTWVSYMWWQGCSTSEMMTSEKKTRTAK